MIANRREYKTTRAAIRRFEQALASDDHPEWRSRSVFRQLLIDSIKAQIQELQISLMTMSIVFRQDRGIALGNTAGVAEALIKARIMRMTQRELAERVGVSEQVVQRDEAQRYERQSSFDRLLLVMTALGLKLVEPVVLSRPEPGPTPAELRRQLLAPRAARQAAP